MVFHVITLRKRNNMKIKKNDRVVKRDIPNFIFRVTDIWQEKQLVQLDGDIWCLECDLVKT